MDIQTDIQIKRPTDSPHGLQVEDGCLTRHRSEVHTACYCPPLHTDSPPVVTYTDSEENRSVTWRRESHTHTTHTLIHTLHTHTHTRTRTHTHTHTHSHTHTHTLAHMHAHSLARIQMTDNCTESSYFDYQSMHSTNTAAENCSSSSSREEHLGSMKTHACAYNGFGPFR